MLRNLKQLGRWLAIAVAIGLVGCAVALAAKPVKPVTPAYSIVPFVSPFPAPDGYSSARSWVEDLNDCGQAVGVEEFSSGSSPKVYRALHLDIATNIYTLLPDASFARGVNNLDQIVGTRTLSDGRLVGMFWKAPDAAPVDLPPLVAPGHTQSAALAINDAGVVVGVSSNDDRSSASAAVWIVKVEGDAVSVHGPWELPPLDDDARGCAEDLNEVIGGCCQVTGDTGQSYEAVVWTVFVDGTTATPGPVVSLVENHAWSVGSAINDSGDVCGLVSVDNKSMPFVAPEDQTAQPLPVPRNTEYGHAYDINNLGEVVGTLRILVKGGWFSREFAYLWKDGAMIDLETQIDCDSGWGLGGAYRINDAGIIAGHGGSLDFQSHGFLLIPNP